MGVVEAAAAAEVCPEGAEDCSLAHCLACAVGGPEDLFVVGGDFGGEEELGLGLGLLGWVCRRCCCCGR